MAGILGLDLGEKRTGIAVSDSDTRVATPLETYEGSAGKSFVRRLQDLIKTYGVTQIVAGLPLDLKGENGPAAKKIREKVEWLKTEIALDWVLWDERLTSAEAEELLQEQGVRRDKRKGLRDQLAAQRILQSYLDSKKR